MNLSRQIGRLVGAGLLTMLPLALSAAPVNAGNTTVTFNTATLSTLSSAGFAISPVTPATLVTSPAVAAAFPVIGGDSTTDIFHSGGLTLTRNGVSASLVNFDINLPSLTLFGQVMTAGGTMNAVPLFNISVANNIDTLTLSSTLGAAISQVFSGVPNLTGAPIGTAVISATATPEPGTLALASLALVGGLAGLRKRRAARN